MDDRGVSLVSLGGDQKLFVESRGRRDVDPQFVPAIRKVQDPGERAPEMTVVAPSTRAGVALRDYVASIGLGQLLDHFLASNGSIWGVSSVRILETTTASG